MDIGLTLPRTGPLATICGLRTVAIAAEQAGYASLWASDRLLVPADRTSSARLRDDTTLDPIVSLTAAAAVTERIGVATKTLLAPLYSPVLLGRAAATLDRLSDSRFTLGLALESSAAEHAAVGVAAGDHQCRIEQMLEVMARVWRDEIVEIETTREVVAPSTIALKPRARRIPIVLGGRGDADLERVARRGDGWLARGVPIVDIAERWSVVTRIAEAYARDVQRLRLVVDAEVLIGDDHGWRNDFVGTVEAVREDIERAREAGADELILDLNGSASSVGHLLDLAAELTDGVEATV